MPSEHLYHCRYFTPARLNGVELLDGGILNPVPIARQKLAAYPPDVIIELPRNLCGTLEFDRADEMIEVGYRLAAEKLA